MKRFLCRAGLFALPFIVYGIILLVVDPFDRFHAAPTSPDSAKTKIASRANFELWTVIVADHHPSPNILLGDSKMVRLKTSEIARVSGLDFINLGMDGASTSDITDLFWRVSRRSQLRNVVIGVNLEGLNRRNNRNLMKAAESVAARPLLYFSSRNVLSATVKLLGVRYFHRPLPSDAPPMGRNEFWQYQLTYGATRNLQGFLFDDGAMAEYARIGAYCSTHGIRLRFILLPTSSDIHAKIREFGLESQWKALPSRLRAIAETSDFDSDNPMTAERANFDDPFHMTDATARALIGAFFSDSVPRATSQP